MDVNKFYQVRLGLMTHDLNCPDPDSMYYVEFAERARQVKDNLSLLHSKMAADGVEHQFEEALSNPEYQSRMFDKYGIPNKRSEPIPTAEHEQNQVRCIRNLMNDFSLTAEQAMELLQIPMGGWRQYKSLLKKVCSQARSGGQ